jgi:hypothetical protein
MSRSAANAARRSASVEVKVQNFKGLVSAPYPIHYLWNRQCSGWQRNIDKEDVKLCSVLAKSSGRRCKWRAGRLATLLSSEGWRIRGHGVFRAAISAFVLVNRVKRERVQ